MSESSDEVISCQPVASPSPPLSSPSPPPLLPGLSYSEALQWRAELVACGFRNVQVVGIRGVVGRYEIEAGYRTPGYVYSFATVHDCRQACRSRAYLPIAGASVGRKVRHRDAAVKGQSVLPGFQP